MSSPRRSATRASAKRSPQSAKAKNAPKRAAKSGIKRAASGRTAAKAGGAKRPPAAGNKSATAKSATARSAVTRSATAKSVVAKSAANSAVSAEAIRLAGEIEKAFAKSDDALSVEAMQTLMGALCRVYSAQVENGATFTPIVEGQAVNPTGVMVTASGLLRAANLAVFELGMWQSWTGR